MSEHPPIYPDEQGDWAAANRGYERRIREWVSQGVHLQAHHVAHVLSILDALRAAPPDPPTSAWRPIESAPKDGQWLMLYVRWQDKRDIIGCGQWTLDGGGDYCWFWPWSNAPTHWMPLPAPPADAGPQKEE